jgi:hypothetical protein
MVKGHKGDDIGKNLEQCLMEWGIEKVMTITVDNASSNDGGISYMRKKLNKSKTSIAEGNYLYMRCAAHIINLIVQDGLKELDDSVKRVRAAVRFVRNGTNRRTKFKQLADLEKVDSEAFLNLDICTRWNSTYLMLKTAIEYERVFTRYEEEDPHYVLDLNSENGPGTPVDSDWENAKKMAEFLGHFYDLTLNVSSTLRVTANEFFHEIGEVNVLLQEWADSNDSLRKAMAKRMQDKYDKYWGRWHEKEVENENENEKGKGKAKAKAKKKEEENMNLLIFVASALDPRFKLSNYTKLVIGEMFGKVNGPKVWEAVNACLKALFEEYKAIYAPTNVGDSQFQENQKREGRRMQSRIAKKLRVGAEVTTSKSELEKYLMEENEEDNIKFDILACWKLNASRFPVLARLARDVLAIPVSTVASESAFSTGGRVLDDFRTSLTPFMVQVLVCSQDWLRRSTPINIEEDVEELEILEKGSIFSKKFLLIVFVTC